MRVDILAARDQVARQRIEQYAAELADKFELDPALAERFSAPLVRDKQVAAMFHREATADFLAALADTGSSYEYGASEPGAISHEVGEAAAKALRDAGYDSPEAIRNASDEDLDAVDGIGPATIKRLRERM